MAIEFHEEGTSLDYVYARRDVPKKENGIMKTLVPIAVVGRKAHLETKNLQCIYDCNFADALPKIVSSLADADSKVVFLSDSNIIDLDKNCDLSIKSIETTYVNESDILENFEDSFN